MTEHEQSNREQRVRMLAYRIWESEGHPEGQESRHWAMAERIVEAENAREEEQEWAPVHEETSPIFEGEDLPLEPDEQGIDEQRLPLDDPEVEALKEADTGVEVHPAPKPSRQRKAATGDKPVTRAKRASSKAAKGAPAQASTPALGANAEPKAAAKKAPAARKPRKPRGDSGDSGETS